MKKINPYTDLSNPEAYFRLTSNRPFVTRKPKNFVSIALKGFRKVWNLPLLDTFETHTIDGDGITMRIRLSQDGGRVFCFERCLDFVGWTTNADDAWKFRDLVAISTRLEVESRRLQALN